MNRLKYCIALVATMIISISAVAQELPTYLYACGGFNRWDVQNCVEFTSEGNGIFTLDMDFTSSRAFKISTADTHSYPTDQAWNAFDNGAYQTLGEAELNNPCPIVKGIDNINAPVSDYIKVTVNFTDMTILFGEGGSPAKPYSQTLPVLIIETENHTPITSKEEYLNATYYLDPLGIEGVEAFGSAEEPLGLKIKGRGNYTWVGFDKKPYRLKLNDKAALLGMKKNKNFALMAAADDNSGFLRNPLGYQTSKLIGLNWTPSVQPVEVMLNGEYIGLYFLTETIKVDKDRVNVTEQADNATDPLEITGGWLLEIDNYDTDPHITLQEPCNPSYPIIFTYKSPEVLSSQQENYLMSQMSTINNLIYGNKNSDELWEHVDIDQLARYYIVQEILDDYESFHGSCYLYKQRGEDEKWNFGPVWDFGSAMMSNKEHFISQDRTWHQVWIGEICRFPAFMEYVINVWKEFDAEKYDELFDYVDDFSSRIATACKFDARRWPQYGNPNEEQKAQAVKNYLSGARAWLEGQWATGIPELKENTTLSVKCVKGGITVDTPFGSTVTICGIDGKVRMHKVSSGTTTITLPAGFYIVNNTKVVVR